MTNFAEEPPRRALLAQPVSPEPMLHGCGRCEACGADTEIAYYHDCLSWLDKECRALGLSRFKIKQ